MRLLHLQRKPDVRPAKCQGILHLGHDEMSASKHYNNACSLTVCRVAFANLFERVFGQALHTSAPRIQGALFFPSVCAGMGSKARMDAIRVHGRWCTCWSTFAFSTSSLRAVGSSLSKFAWCKLQLCRNSMAGAVSVSAHVQPPWP